MKYLKKKAIILYSIIFNIFYFNFARAKALDQSVSDEIYNQVNAMNQDAGFAANSVGGIMAIVIKAFLGLLGIIFLVLIIIAGYNWMTAAGDEEKVNKAKETIQRAIIGIIIIISAYAITYFVFKNLGGVGSGGVESPPVPR